MPNHRGWREVLQARSIRDDGGAAGKSVEYSVFFRKAGVNGRVVVHACLPCQETSAGAAEGAVPRDNCPLPDALYRKEASAAMAAAGPCPEY